MAMSSSQTVPPVGRCDVMTTAAGDHPLLVLVTPVYSTIASTSCQVPAASAVGVVAAAPKPGESAAATAAPVVVVVPASRSRTPAGLQRAHSLSLYDPAVIDLLTGRAMVTVADEARLILAACRPPCRR